jgi:FtsH-binding integral membrane protein
LFIILYSFFFSLFFLKTEIYEIDDVKKKNKKKNNNYKIKMGELYINMTPRQLLDGIFGVAIIHILVSIIGLLCSPTKPTTKSTEQPAGEPSPKSSLKATTTYLSSARKNLPCNTLFPAVDGQIKIGWILSLLACGLLLFFSSVLYKQYTRESTDKDTKILVITLIVLSIAHALVSFLSLICASASQNLICQTLQHWGWGISFLVVIVISGISGDLRNKA